MPSRATTVLLNGGKAKLIGHRPANSHKPKNKTNESNCQKRGFAICRLCSTESVFSGPDKEAQSAASRSIVSRQRARGRSNGVMEYWSDAFQTQYSITPTLQLRLT